MEIVWVWLNACSTNCTPYSIIVFCSVIVFSLFSLVIMFTLFSLKKRQKAEEGEVVCSTLDSKPSDVTPKETNDVIDHVIEDKTVLSPIDRFPDEMLAMVFSHLSPRDLLAW
jgi:hypothetical protein